MLVADVMLRLFVAVALMLIAGVVISSAAGRREVARVKTFWCHGDTPRDERLFRGERPPASVSIENVPASEGNRFRAFVFGGVHVVAPRNWGGCSASGRPGSTSIHVSDGQVVGLRQLSVHRAGPPGTASLSIACRAFADAKRLALKRGVSLDSFCFPLETSARGTITRTKNLVTVADPDPPGTASRHFIWWFPKTQKAASLECFAPPSRLGFCDTAFRDFNQHIRAYATG